LRRGSKKSIEALPICKGARSSSPMIIETPPTVLSDFSFSGLVGTYRLGKISLPTNDANMSRS
jgi:hypothetical protein